MTAEAAEAESAGFESFVTVGSTTKTTSQQMLMITNRGGWTQFIPLELLVPARAPDAIPLERACADDDADHLLRPKPGCLRCLHGSWKRIGDRKKANAHHPGPVPP